MCVEVCQRLVLGPSLGQRLLIVVALRGVLASATGSHMFSPEKCRRSRSDALATTGTDQEESTCDGGPRWWCSSQPVFPLCNSQRFELKCRRIMNRKRIKVCGWRRETDGSRCYSSVDMSVSSGSDLLPPNERPSSYAVGDSFRLSEC